MNMQPTNEWQCDRPVTVIIVGAGNRSMKYAAYALRHPERMRVVGVVDPDSLRRHNTAEKYGLTEEMCFESVERLVGLPKLADAVINGTMDLMHVPTSLPLLRKGYDLMLEKPIGVSEAEVLELYDTATAHGCKVMVCHVLRYAPFYAEIQKVVAEGGIGDIVHIQTEENVSYHHMATAFVRGKWGNTEIGGSSFLMAKCCHDLDLLTWFKSGSRPLKVSSFGRRSQFRADKAPAGAGTRCLTDCKIEESCTYSAKKLYLDQPLWSGYVWPDHIHGVRLDPEQKRKLIETDSPYGRCVWKCDNDIVDHQAVLIEFADGSTAVHNLVGGTAKPSRTIHIIGTKGEIEGEMESGEFIIRTPDPRPNREYEVKRIKLNVSKDMHGGGDVRIVEDFVNVVRGAADSRFATSLDNSILGHLCGFRADASRLEGRTMTIGWKEAMPRP
ncbi:Gfo/Idh/MocA family oxidoreductase [Paenibacillus hemerocallicola]|uniref:Gfo/Idh/MocA family oxidoreductase n=1 Tax=Paenibacillus hemerocallicola TaxID=1172614 RepID=A0A5C4T6B5_9BACL|nr:Gfo/Idh/MocA family oxidoreductase [Paenibacillus hemerocallicola]TNJ63749.1 Gfo/Idh/MocA family oxidoreductase [Paenibacillus hemerocallicola]